MCDPANEHTAQGASMKCNCREQKRNSIIGSYYISLVYIWIQIQKFDSHYTQVSLLLFYVSTSKIFPLFCSHKLFDSHYMQLSLLLFYVSTSKIFLLFCSHKVT